MNSTVSVGITGMGVALPAEVRTNAFWNGKLGSRSDAQRRGDILAIEQSTNGESHKLSASIQSAMSNMDDVFRGAELRHVLPDDVELSELEAKAVRAALTDAGIKPQSVDLLLVHSLPNDYATPFNAPMVQHRAGLTSAVGWNLEVGCGSFQAQLVAATGLLRSGSFRRAVIVQSSAMSRILDFNTPMSVGFGDGAVAAVIDRLPDGYGLMAHSASTDGSLRDGVVIAATNEGKPRGEWWRGVGPMVLTSNDPEMGKSMGIEGPRFCKETCLETLRRAEKTIDDVDWFVCNQSVGWFVDACSKELGIPAEKTINTFKTVANIGAAAVLYNLVELRQRGLLKDGQLVLTYQPSAGFTKAASLFRWHAPKP